MYVLTNFTRIPNVYYFLFHIAFLYYKLISSKSKTTYTLDKTTTWYTLYS